MRVSRCLPLPLLLVLSALLLVAPPASAGTDDYPSQWRTVPQDSLTDTWSYPNRECTSFVAWRMHSRNGFEMPRYIGNANQWDDWARRSGYRVDGSPSVGSIAQTDAGTAGHVAWVEAVGNGSVTIEEYNHNWNGTYDERVVPTSTFVYLHVKDLASAEYFIKTKYTGSGRVEIHTATAATNYQGSDLHTTTWFSSGDANNGWFQMVGRDLFFIKTKNTGSGRVEIHTATAATNYQGSDLHTTTWFSPGDANNGWFQMVGRDLFFIKTQNTGSGRVEIHTATAATNYQGSDLHTTTWFSPGDANNGWFQMVGRDLFFIKTKNTGSGRVEIHTATAATNYQGSDLHTTTWFSPGDANNGWFQMVGRDLFFIKTKNTGSGRVEIHTATAATNYQGSDLHTTTWFSPADANNGWFQMQGAKQ